MNKFYCIELKFRTPFSSDTSFHSHLYLKEDKIEIRVLLKDQKDFSDKFMMWFGDNTDSDNISNYIEAEVIKNGNEKDLYAISLQSSKITGITSEREDKAGRTYFTITIDQITLYKNPVELEREYAKIYLNQDGFDLVKNFYSIFTGFRNDGKVDIGRMRGMDSFYKIANTKFRPEYEFEVSDNRNDRSPKIVKIPILKFYFNKNETDENIMTYFSIACKICSFYLGNNIEFNRALICREDKRIIIRKILQTKFTLNVSSLNWLLNVQGIDGFLKLNWQKKYLINQAKINEAITNYTHARLLDTNSRFMLLYNIIDICMGGEKVKSDKFNLVVNAKTKKGIYQNAFSIIKQTVAENELADFEKKWNIVQDKLIYKPMKSPLNEFLLSNRINTEVFEISIDKMKQFRDAIFHGSVDSKTTELIKKSNMELFRITPILILNLLGVENWVQRI